MFLFQIEANPEARNELTKLIGVLGAVDCFNLFKLQNHQNLHLSNENLVNIIRNNHKSHFYFESSLLNDSETVLDWKWNEDPSEQRLKTYFRSIINLNQILDNKATDDTLTQVIELNELDTRKTEKKNVSQIIEAEIGIVDESLKDLLQFMDPINLSDVDSLLNYITSVTIKTLLMYLFDSTYIANHRVIIECLNLLVYTIGRETSSYLHILVPSLSHYTKQKSCTLDHQILQLFERILKACGSNFGQKSQKNIDLLMEIILRNLSEGKFKEKCLDTLIELMKTSKLL